MCFCLLLQFCQAVFVDLLTHSFHSSYNILPVPVARKMDVELLADLGRQLQLIVDEEQSLKVRVDLWNACDVRIDLCLVGRTMTRKPVHMDSFERTMVGAWNPGKGVSVIGRRSLLVSI